MSSTLKTVQISYQHIIDAYFIVYHPIWTKITVKYLHNAQTWN